MDIYQNKFSSFEKNKITWQLDDNYLQQKLIGIIEKKQQ